MEGGEASGRHAAVAALPILNVGDGERVVGIFAKSGVMSKTTSRRIICFSGISSMVRPLESKCAGGSMWVPYLADQ